MLESLTAVVRHPDFWKYASIPFVAAVVGWATNWVAVKMTFYPLRFFGLRPYLGWQGIIPAKAGKMAATFVDSTMSRLGTLPELFDSLEPQRIADHVIAYVEPRIDQYTDDILLQHHQVLWENTPWLIKRQAYARAREEMPKLIRNLFAEARDKVEDLIDFRHMIVTRLVEDPALLNRLFVESGAAEFRFIIRSGFTYGFLFGTLQLGVYLLYPAWWTLPVFGLLVGWATNWIALNLIFRPLQPRKIGPWTLHGLFLRRQKQVAGVWCKIVTSEILTVRQLIDASLTGPLAENTRRLIQRHIKPVVDDAVGVVRPAVQMAVGTRGFAEIKSSVGDKAIAVSSRPFDDPIFNRERGQIIETLLRERMEELPSEQFQDLLRPCFQEDEWKLVLLGAVLGALAGIAQAIFVFGA